MPKALTTKAGALHRIQQGPDDGQASANKAAVYCPLHTRVDSECGGRCSMSARYEFVPGDTITISGPGYVGRQIQDAIASAYAELQRADEQQAVEAEHYGGSA